MLADCQLHCQPLNRFVSCHQLATIQLDDSSPWQYKRGRLPTPSQRGLKIHFRAFGRGFRLVLQPVTRTVRGGGHRQSILSQTATITMVTRHGRHRIQPQQLNIQEYYGYVQGSKVPTSECLFPEGSTQGRSGYLVLYTFLSPDAATMEALLPVMLLCIVSKMSLIICSAGGTSGICCHILAPYVRWLREPWLGHCTSPYTSPLPSQTAASPYTSPLPSDDHTTWKRSIESVTSQLWLTIHFTAGLAQAL